MEISKSDEFLNVVDLFQNDKDEKALNLLYRLTNDSIVKIALDWRKEYEESLESVYSDASYMYNDVISYIYEKYKLNEISKEDNEKSLQDYDY